MIIEKTVIEGNRYNVELDDYVAEGELTVTITLSEYRQLIKTSVENQHRKEHENWLEQYSRANEAEAKVKELETEVCELYKKLADAEPQKSEGITTRYGWCHEYKRPVDEDDYCSYGEHGEESEVEE